MLGFAEKLLNMGHEVTVINYVPAALKSRLPFWKGGEFVQGFVRNFTPRLMRIVFEKCAELKFDTFRSDYLNLSKLCFDL